AQAVRLLLELRSVCRRRRGAHDRAACRRVRSCRVHLAATAPCDRRRYPDRPLNPWKREVRPCDWRPRWLHCRDGCSIATGSYWSSTSPRGLPCILAPAAARISKAASVSCASVCPTRRHWLIGSTATPAAASSLAA